MTILRPTLGLVTRRLLSAVLIGAMILPAGYFILSAGVMSAATTTAFQPAGKYNRFYVTYVDRSGFTEVNFANVSGSIGGAFPNSGYRVWQRYIASLWRQDPSTGTWYNLLNTTPSGWSQCASLCAQDYNFGTYYVSDYANVQMRNRYECLSGQGCTYHCLTGVDFEFWGDGSYQYTSWGTMSPC